MTSVGVFCGALEGHDPVFHAAAAELGETLAKKGIRVVFGGGHIGMMGVVANAALAASGEVVGVIPRDLLVRERVHDRVTKLHVVDGMHERKALMCALADAFVVLPGGFGTLEEFFEVLTWSQLGFHDKPCCLVNVAGFFDHLCAHIDFAVAQGFVHERYQSLVRVVASPAEVLDRLGL